MFHKTTLHRPRTYEDRVSFPAASFLFFFPPFLRTFAQFVSLAHSLFHVRVRPSREEFLKINIGAKRGGAAKKFDIPFASFLFIFFNVSTFFFCNANCAVERLVPLRSPEGRMAIRINSIFEEQNLRRKWLCESTGTEEARENLFSQKCSVASVQSLPLPVE